MGNLRDANKLRPMKPTDVVLGADEQGCLVNFPPENFSGSIPVNIDTETGDGQELFTEPQVNDYLFKKIKSKDGSTDVITDTDGNIDLSVNFPPFPPFPEIPTVDYPVIESEDVGEGVSLRRNLVSKKIGIRTLKSDSFIITEEIDGSVKINTAGGGSTSDDYYFDANFIRPSNWTEKAESIDGIKTAQGTLNDPFKTFEEYLRRCIGEAGGSNGFGLYSRVNPKNPNKTLKLLSELNTDKVLEINNSTISSGNFQITYTGSENYAADTERLWDAMPKTGGVLNRGIFWGFSGNGSIVNLYHFGAINHKTSVASTTPLIKCFLNITPEIVLKITESSGSATYTPMTNADGSPYLHAGIQVQGSTQAPIRPLLRFDGKNNNTWSAEILGGKLEIISCTQSFIELVNGAEVTSSADSINYLVNSRYIGYEKKLYTGLGGMTSDETELLIGRDGLFFKPYAGRKVFNVADGVLRTERISTISDSRNQIAVDSIFHVGANSTLYVLEKYIDTGGGSAISLISSAGTGATVILNNSTQTYYMNFFVKGDNTNPVNVIFENSKVNSIDKIKKNAPTLNVNTVGSWSVVKQIPINTGIASFTNNAAAVAANYITGMTYFNTTENAVSKVL